MKYNHAFTLGFSVVSEHPEAEDITPEQFAAAIHQRVAECLIRDQNGHCEMLEAVLPPYDTYKEEEDTDE